MNSKFARTIETKIKLTHDPVTFPLRLKAILIPVKLQLTDLMIQNLPLQEQARHTIKTVLRTLPIITVKVLFNQPIVVLA